MRRGTVYLVGAGPGDPGLCTVRGLELIQKADVIVHDFLASPRLVAQRRPDVRMIFVGKRAGERSMSQEAINNLLVDLAEQHAVVVRLKGGDPFVFGRGGEEALELAQRGVRFEIVPGVTSGVAAPAYAGIPLTHRGVAASALLVTGHEDPEKGIADLDWIKLARTNATLVFYMGVRNIGRIAIRLIDSGRSPETPAALIQWGSTASQKCATARLSRIAEEVARMEVGPPAILIVGSVVSLRDHIRWFDDLPLFGKRIVVTRSRDQRSELSFGLEVLGAQITEVPTIEIRPPVSFERLDGAAAGVGEYDWIVFASANGVASFFDRLVAVGSDARGMAGVRCAAVGRATAKALRDRGIVADLVPRKMTSEGLLDEIDSKKISVDGQRFLFPASELGRTLIPEGITARRGIVDRVVAYRTVEPDLPHPALDIALDPLPDLVTFTSSSTVENFCRMLERSGRRDMLGRIRAATIGPLTTRTAKEKGIRVAVESHESMVAAMIESIEEYFDAERSSPGSS